MAKAGHEYQEIVAAVATALHRGSTVKTGQWVAGPDGSREVDVEVRGSFLRPSRLRADWMQRSHQTHRHTGTGSQAPERNAGRTGKEKHMKPHRMVVRKTANAGYIAEHHYKPEPGGPTPDSDEYQLPTLARLKKHIGAHFEPEPIRMAVPSSFEDGGQVQQTGLALVHNGEKVVPAKPKQKQTVPQDRDEIRSLRSGRKQLLDSLPDPRREWTGRDPQTEDPRQMRQGPLEDFPMKRI
jgi:hypothetical protein